MNFKELNEFLDAKVDQYNRKSFIGPDPIMVPHLFSKREDIEIAAFLAATIAWGQRTTIVKNAKQLVEWMDMEPHQFILNAQAADLNVFKKFKHRTFNGDDCVYFLRSLQHIYKKKEGLEKAFLPHKSNNESKVLHAITNFRNVFFALPHPERTKKHVSDPMAGSAAKRLNMFLRWMVRKDKRGVDFGIWNGLKPADLMCPLDVHSGNVARKLGLLVRTQNDWKAVEELTQNLRNFDPKDPVKYDLALFGLGVFEGF